MSGFHVVIVSATQYSQAIGRISTDPELMGHPGIFHIHDKQLGGVKAIVRIGRIVYIAATEVVGDIAATIVVMGVVDNTLYVTIQVTAGVYDIQVANTAIKGPGGKSEFIFVVILGKSGGRLLPAEAGIDQEYAIYVQFLVGVLNQNVPIVIDFKSQGGAPAAIGCFIPVVLYQIIVSSSCNGIGAG